MRVSMISASSLLLLLGMSCGPLAAQTFAAGTSARPELGGDVPVNTPSALPPHHKKTDAPLLYARVRGGIYSVDGMVGKVKLNYDVRGASYLYFFVPGLGTAVVSLEPSAEGVLEPGTYHDGELTMRAGDHTLNLTGVESLVDDKGKQPGPLYVRLDRNAWRLSRGPMLGFGAASQAPYEWPGAMPSQPVAAEAGEATLPVPPALLPRTVAYKVPASALR